MKHRHFDLIVQWASDPDAYLLEFYDKAKKKWVLFPSGPLRATVGWMEDCEYRLIPKRRMMHLNGVEFPAPEKEAPPVGTKYYIARPGREEYWSWLEWDGDRDNYFFLNRGLVHLTREAAEAHARAMLAAKEVE